MKTFLVCALAAMCFAMCSGQGGKCSGLLKKENQQRKRMEREFERKGRKPEDIKMAMEKACPEITEAFSKSIDMTKPNQVLPMTKDCKTKYIKISQIKVNGEWCDIIPDQKVYSVKCGYESCCDKFDNGALCRPSNYLTYLLHVHCPKINQCIIVKQSYPSSCSCQRLKC